MRILAIDPGNDQSAYVLIDADTRQPLQFAKVSNDGLISDLRAALVIGLFDHAVIEMVSSYGMAVGADVFETCVWGGRFTQKIKDSRGVEPELIKRGPVKLHHCGSPHAKDSNVTQALKDRFGGKGTKANPGWFYGFKADVWQAYALAVYAADTMNNEQGAA